jgi:hypothetical protein
MAEISDAYNGSMAEFRDAYNTGYRDGESSHQADLLNALDDYIDQIDQDLPIRSTVALLDRLTAERDALREEVGSLTALLEARAHEPGDL